MEKSMSAKAQGLLLAPSKRQAKYKKHFEKKRDGVGLI
jgi:hypothetical protein